jgi:ferredoxin
MIVGEQKSIEEIYNMIKNYDKILIGGCNTCVAICHAGGEKEVGILASALRIKSKTEGEEKTIDEDIVERQCEKEFVEKLENKIQNYDAVLSLACGIGPQTMIEVFPKKEILPGLNTTFYGMPEEQGVFEERCGGCGNCVLDITGGVCPIVRCSKSMLNGPCGGSQEGKCEVNVEIACGWQLIYDRLEALGKLDSMDEITPPKDWTSGRHGGPRKMVREDLVIENLPEENKESKTQSKEGDK